MASTSFSRTQIRKFLSGVTPAELDFLEDVTAGTATANKALVLNGSKGISTITSATITTLTSTTVNATTVNATTSNPTNLNVGASGTAGVFKVFPTTAAKGYVTIAPSDNTGDTATTISIAAQSTTRTYTVVDAGINCNFLMVNASATAGAAITSATGTEISQQCDQSDQTETLSANGAIAVNKRITQLATSGAGACTIATPAAVMIGLVKVIAMTVDNGDVTLANTNIAGYPSGTTATFGDVGDTMILVGGTTKWIFCGHNGLTFA